MTHRSRRLLSGWLALALLILSDCGAAAPGAVPSSQPPLPRLLVFAKTAAFHHASFPAAIAALRRLGRSIRSPDVTEDAAVFTSSNLARYAVVIFLLTTGTVLDSEQAAALQGYLHAGSYVGIHSASHTEHGWPWYGQLVGAYFDRVHGHAAVERARLHVVDPHTPLTAMLPATWIRTDEWYNFATNPTGSVEVLVTIDEATYQGGVMGATTL